MDIQSFLLALINDWVSVMGGAVSIILTIAGFVIPDRWHPRLFWSAALLCFLIASARVWTIEHEARMAKQKELDDLTVPQLFGTIRQYSEGKGAVAAGEPFVVIMTASIGNRGADSIAEGFELLLTTARGREFAVPATVFSFPLRITAGSQRLESIPGSELFNLTSKPIKRGELPTGHIIFAMDDRALATGEDRVTKAAIRFVDYLGKSYESEPLNPNRNASPEMHYFPGIGLRPQVQQSAP